MDRFTWGIVVGVLVLVLLGVSAAALVRTQEVTPDLATPGGVALAFEQALDRGDAEGAWVLLARSAQAQTTRDRFLTRASAFHQTDNRSRLAVENVEGNGDSARAEVVRTFNASGLGPFFSSSSTTRNTVRLAREDGTWRVTVPAQPYLLDPARS